MNETEDCAVVEYEITYKVKVTWCVEDELTPETLETVQTLADHQVVGIAQDSGLLPYDVEMQNIRVRRTR